MNSSIIRFVLGYVLKMEAVLMLLPCIVAVLYREQTGFAYLLVAAVSMFTFGKVNSGFYCLFIKVEQKCRGLLIGI